MRCAGVAYEHLCEGRRPLGHVEGVEAGGAVHLAQAAVDPAALGMPGGEWLAEAAARFAAGLVAAA